MKNLHSHYVKQLSYFGYEFGHVGKYRLESWQKSYIEKIKKYMLGESHKKVLIDIASGSGYISVEMAKLGLNVIATDLSSEAINNLNKYKKQFSLHNLTIKKCFAEKIPLPDKSVDFIVANAILEHIPGEMQAIEEWKRILKPGGKMFITVPLKYQYVWPFLWIPNYVHDKRIGHLRRYDLNTLKYRFKLPIINVFYSGHLIKILVIIIAVVLKTSRFDDYFEDIDQTMQSKIYGASNISVIFKNEK